MDFNVAMPDFKRAGIGARSFQGIYSQQRLNFLRIDEQSLPEGVGMAMKKEQINVRYASQSRLYSHIEP